VVIDHKLYWAAASSAEEARYLLALLNAEVTTNRVRPLQARGEHNPRDFDLYVWRLAFSIFDPMDERHQELASLCAEAEGFVGALDLPDGVAFEALRRRVREAVAVSETGQRIENLVTELLA
jgi:hypothetical protein